MSAMDVMASFVLPIGSAVLLGGGLLSWLSFRSSRRGEPFGPRRWETVAILVGAGLVALYVGLVAPFGSAALRIVALLIILVTVAYNVWFVRRTRESVQHRRKEIADLDQLFRSS
jgi:hypothetical protein